ncbi:cadherin-like domain-containing protein, partial [Ensifer sp. NBAIM29]|nr:cadherin-like domain-containing protein [Ensifer sp. NBAIM29]
NDDPTTAPVTLAAIAEDGGPRLITQAELLAQAGDVDGDSLTATNLQIVSGGGTLVDNEDGTWTYTPAADDDTAVSFGYAIADGHGGSTAGAASLDITPVNDDPTTAPVTLAAIAEDGGPRLITQAELLAQAGDVDGDSLTATNLQIVSGGGTLVDNEDGTWTYTPAADDDTAVSFGY